MRGQSKSWGTRITRNLSESNLGVYRLSKRINDIVVISGISGFSGLSISNLSEIPEEPDDSLGR